jgi:hypothetical protein
MCGGGVQFSPNTSHVIRKQMVNSTLVTGHQAASAHCYKCHILQRICSTQYFTILLWDWGRRQKARSIPGDTWILFPVLIYTRVTFLSCSFSVLKGPLFEIFRMIKTEGRMVLGQLNMGKHLPNSDTTHKSRCLWIAFHPKKTRNWPWVVEYESETIF